MGTMNSTGSSAGSIGMGAANSVLYIPICRYDWGPEMLLLGSLSIGAEFGHVVTNR